jgi:hypothetical protein
MPFSKHRIEHVFWQTAKNKDIPEQKFPIFIERT